MKKIMLLLSLMLLLLGGCKKKCDSCAEHQYCDNGICKCSEWFEGSNCQTAMSAKFGGTFIGTTSTNGSSAAADTFIFKADTILGFYADLVNSQLGSRLKNEAIIQLKSSLEGNYALAYSEAPQMYDAQKTCGHVSITSDGRTLTLSFNPISSAGLVDSNTLYTFIGVKQ